MKTITVGDDIFLALMAAMLATDQLPTAPSPVPAPVPAPTKDSVITVPWAARAGTFTTTIDPGETVSFAFIPQNTNGKLANFGVSPTDGNAYFAREHALSDKPGDLRGSSAPQQSYRFYFSCGGHPIDRYGRADTRYPDLLPGKTYYVNVRQQDPTLTCRVNYALMPA